MKNQKYKVIGVMSGTSLDGIDLAEINFSVVDNSYTYKIGVTQTVPYDAAWKAILAEAIHYAGGRLKSLNTSYTKYLATVISAFILENKLQHIDAVCSHGHTILHQPENGITLQIGNLPELASLIQQTLVCDFRVQDVQLGGQGAPLVPIGDRMLFSEYNYCLNLGGFANCSSEIGATRIAYDICPVNIVLNALAEKLGLPYDDGGQTAKASDVDKIVLQELNLLPFYQQHPPKSLGLEWVQEHIWPVLRASKISVANKIATFTEHVAMQLASQFDTGSSVLVTGGGAYNSYLLKRVLHHKKLNLIVPEVTLLEYKEALIFGLLGVLRLRNEVNCLASVTGARQDHVSGVIFKPKK